MRVKRHLFSVILVVAFLPIFLLNYSDKKKLTAVEENANKKIMQNTSNILNNEISSYFEDISIMSNSLSDDKDIKNVLVSSYSKVSENKKQALQYSLKYCESLFQSIKKYELSVDNIIVMNKNNDIILSANKIDCSDLIEGIFSSKNIEISNNFSELFICRNSTDKTPKFAYISVIFDANNKKLGTSVIVFNTSYLQKIINDSKVFKTSDNFLIDFKGNILAYPFTQLNNYNDNTSLQIPDVTVGEFYTEGDIGVFRNYKSNGVEKTSFISNVKKSKLILAVVANQDEFISQTQIVKVSMNMIVGYITLIIFIFAIFYVNKATKPINEIMLTIKKKKRGDKYARFEVSSKNEFFDISEAFNYMIDDISESEQRYRTVVEMSDNIVFEYNIKKNIVRFSDDFYKKFSFRPNSERYQDSFWANCEVHKEDRANYRNVLKNAFKMGSNLQGEFRFKALYGDYIWFLIRATLLYGRDDRPIKVIGVMVDIDRAKKGEMKLLQRANYDGLTSLLKRNIFEKRLINEYELSRMRKERIAVLFIDLDDFKHYNDEYGHAYGDEVLKFVSTTITDLLGNHGFAGRYGGDEFVICLNTHYSEDEISEFAQKLIKNLSKGFESKCIDLVHSIYCSIGISFVAEDGSNLDTVIEEADSSMYTVKKHGKSNFAFHSRL